MSSVEAAGGVLSTLGTGSGLASAATAGDLAVPSKSCEVSLTGSSGASSTPASAGPSASVPLSGLLLSACTVAAGCAESLPSGPSVPAATGWGCTLTGSRSASCEAPFTPLTCTALLPDSCSSVARTTGGCAAVAALPAAGAAMSERSPKVLLRSASWLLCGASSCAAAAEAALSAALSIRSPFAGAVLTSLTAELADGAARSVLGPPRVAAAPPFLDGPVAKTSAGCASSAVVAGAPSESSGAADAALDPAAIAATAAALPSSVSVGTSAPSRTTPGIDSEAGWAAVLEVSLVLRTAGGTIAPVDGAAAGAAMGLGAEPGRAAALFTGDPDRPTAAARLLSDAGRPGGSLARLPGAGLPLRAGEEVPSRVPLPAGDRFCPPFEACTQQVGQSELSTIGLFQRLSFQLSALQLHTWPCGFVFKHSKMDSSQPQIDCKPGAVCAAFLHDLTGGSMPDGAASARHVPVP